MVSRNKSYRTFKHQYSHSALIAWPYLSSCSSRSTEKTSRNRLTTLPRG